MKDGFEHFYISWYSRAKNFAREYVLDDVEAENIVQDVFIKVYERWNLFDENINLTSYFFTAIKNESLKTLRKKLTVEKAKERIQKEYTMEIRLRYDSLESLNTAFSDEKSIEDLLYDALNKLPERCRQIFVMNKLKGKKQKQIAEELGISVNTVEVQMGIAYKKLREELKDYLPIILFLFGFINKQ